MRADRLVATLLVLQARGRVTAAELATELEVSVATARRDLEGLSAAGVPVYPQPGRGGGWSLVGGARTDLSGLTAAEAQALFLLAGPAAASAPEVKSGLRKLVRALPATFRADAEAAAGAVMVDSARWGERSRELPEMVGHLQSAVVRRRKVRLTYTNRVRERTVRLIDPWGLVDKDGIWYLVAGGESGRRTFRVDRIVGADITEVPAERPDNFDLAEEWDRVVDVVEQQRATTEATVLVPERLLPVLQSHSGRHFQVDSPAADGRIRARVSAPTPLMVAQNLAGWGAIIDVEGPESVRSELARFGAELVGRYAAPAELSGVPGPTVAGADGSGHDHRMFLDEPPQSDLATQLFDEDRESGGYVDNLTRLWSWRPDALVAFYESRSVLLTESGLVPSEIALINAATAAARSNSYCALAWGTKLAEEIDAETSARVLSGSLDDLDPRTAALAGWARKVAIDPTSTTPADVQRLREVGLTDRQIFEVTMLAAWRLAFSTVNDALGAQPDLQLAEKAPEGVRAAVRYGRPVSDTPST